MNLGIQQNARNFLNTYVTTSFSRTLFRGFIFCGLQMLLLTCAVKKNKLKGTGEVGNAFELG